MPAVLRAEMGREPILPESGGERKTKMRFEERIREEDPSR